MEGEQGGTWYPSVLTFLDPALVPPRFRPIVVGGTGVYPSGPFGSTICNTRYAGWWTMSLPVGGLQPTWEFVSSPDAYKWQAYPRALFTHTGSGQGEILTAGHDRVCLEDPPCHRVLTSANPQTHQEFNQPSGVGYWHENNAVLQHTLKPDWEWDTVSPLEHYDLNRLFGTMGVAVESAESLGLPEIRELVYSNTLPAPPPERMSGPL
jgi:hypothetical protein